MVAGLKSGTRRHLAGAAIVLAVTALHVGVTEQFAEHAASFSARSGMPPRMQIAYVRQMTLAPPPRVVRAPPPSRPKRRAEAAVVAAPVVSEAVAEPEHPASAPELPSALPEPVVPEAVPTVDAAASASTLTPAAQAAASAASSPDGAVPFEWPGSTRMRYALTGNYRGEVYGRAQVEWIHVGEHYQVHLDVSVGPSFAPFMERTMSSDGDITPEGLAPRRYDQETRIGFQNPYRATMSFEPDAIVFSNGRRDVRLPGEQDTASQFVQLTWMFASGRQELRAGNTVTVPLAMPRYASDWIYDVLGEETLYTAFGAVQAFHLKPRREPRAGGDLVTDIWIAPQLRHLPVRFLIRQDASTFVDLMLERLPELAAPETLTGEKRP